MTVAERKYQMSLSEDDLRVISLALWTYVDSFEGDYDDDTVRMEKLMERIRASRRRRNR